MTPAISIDAVADDYAERLRAGTAPTIDSIVAKHPAIADELRDVLDAVKLMEELKPRRTDAPILKSAPMPERLGDYRILREIGRGGMGIVYEAEHESLGRRVALKLLPSHLLANEKVRARFRREAQAAARLHHTNIVPVFGVGSDNGQSFYIMQLIKGQGLDRPLRRRETAVMPPKTIARLGAQVADALAYAHGQGVLHRDIKPSNLIVDEQGTVWIADFGVAKLLEDSEITQSGDVVGTLRYMSPERFDGASDASGDIYSLGVTLYELLTGESAFPETTPQRLIQMISKNGLAPLPKQVPGDLATIVMKAVAREPAHRYTTAAAFADDLRRFVEDRPIRARRTGVLARNYRWAKRNPVLAALTGLAFTLMIGITVVSMVLAAKSREAKADSDAARDQLADAKSKVDAALAAEQDHRRQSEQTASQALEALNRTYDWFAPSRLLAVPPDPTGIDLPPQTAVLTPESVPLLENLIRTYDGIAKQAAGYASLRPQVAEANHRRGDIDQRLGRFDKALDAYAAAGELYKQLAAETNNTDWTVKQARVLNETGRVRWLRQQFDAATVAHQSAIALLKPLSDRPEARYELAWSYIDMDQPDMFQLKHRGPPDRGPAERPPSPAVAILQSLVQDYPDVTEYRHLLARCLRDAGQEAEAVKLLRELIAAAPKAPDYKYELALTMGRGGPVADRDPEAHAKLNEAIRLTDDLVTQFPNMPEYAAANARFQDFLSIYFIRRQQWKDAVAASRKAVARQTEVVKQYPTVTTYSLWLGMMERTLGDALAGTGDHSEAVTLMTRAVQRVEALGEATVSLPGVKVFLGLAWSDLARELNELSRTVEANAATESSNKYGGRPAFPDGGPGGMRPSK